MNLQNLIRRQTAFLMTMVLAGLLIAQVCVGQTPYPMVMSLEPVAAQQGQTSEHTVRSRYNMFGAYRVLVSGLSLIHI